MCTKFIIHTPPTLSNMTLYYPYSYLKAKCKKISHCFQSHGCFCYVFPKVVDLLSAWQTIKTDCPENSGSCISMLQNSNLHFSGNKIIYPYLLDGPILTPLYF